jgi:signal transduction histidine kinase
VLVPELADWYCVDVLEGGVLRSIAVEHADPAKAALARDVHARAPAQWDDEEGLYAVVRTGRSDLRKEFGDDLLVAKAGGDRDLLAMMRTLRPCSAMFVPLKASGQTLGAMKLFFSDSGRHYDENDLATAEELGRRIGMAIENARAYHEAREAIRLRDEFLAIAGHELRTPLTALTLQLQAAAVSVTRGESAAPRVDRSLANVGRLQQLIDHLLDVSQITSRPLALERREIDLAVLWRAVIERHAPEAARTGSVVSFTSSGETVGYWDRSRMDQVLTSLLGNALKYGNGKPVRVSLQGDAGTVRILVQDEGMGIDLSAQPRIFGRFERAVSVRNYGGFGLGLWVVRELVEAHGGTVGFESQPGRGSTFWVELPCGINASSE